MTNNKKPSAWPSMLSPPFLGSASVDGSNPLAQSLSSGVEFMQNLWGKVPAGVPGFVVPSVDVEELDKRIADLKAVEGWLELNANMLKATIQGLEVQRNTVATLKAMGQHGGINQVLQDLQKIQTQAGWSQPVSSAAALGGNLNWPMAPSGVDQPAPAPAWQAEPPAESTPPKSPKSPVAKKAAASRSATAGKAEPAPPDDAMNSAAMASANMWMNFLKEQFSQIAGAAVRSGEVLPAPAAGSAKGSIKKAAKKKSLPKKRAKNHAAAKRLLAPRR